MIRFRGAATDSDRRRRQLRAGAAGAFVCGIALLGVGILAPGLSSDTTPRALVRGQVTILPSAGPFAGTVALYARLDDARVVPISDLACTVLDDEGRPATDGSPGISATGLDALDRIVVDEIAVRPVLRVVVSGRSIRCDGAAVDALAPTYVRAQAGVDAMVPMAAWSLTSLLMVLGVSGMVTLRPREE